MFTPQNIIVRTPNWVGDAVMSLPFFASLRRNAPDAQISVLTRPPLRAVFEADSGVDHVITLDESSGARGWRMTWTNARRLRSGNFDLGFALPPSFGSALMLRIGGVQNVIGHASDARKILLSNSLPYAANGKRLHRSEGYLSLLSLIWANPTIDRELKFVPGARAVKSVDEIWRSRGLAGETRIMAIAPGAAQPNKIWAGDRFAGIARIWLQSQRGTVLIVGGTGDRTTCSGVVEAISEPNVIDLCGIGDLAVTAEIIRRSACFVGNDSGLAHLSAAVGAKTVVISGPGDPSEVTPFSPLAATVKKPLFCSPCYRNSCWRTDHPLECQDLVTVDDVWEAITETVS